MTQKPSLRVAVYYAPAADDPLWIAGCRWLGRDPENGEAHQPPEVVSDPTLIADPSGYGFHGTLKPPMRLAEGVTYDDFVTGVRRLAQGLIPFAMPRLSVQNLHGFLAVRESAPSPELQALSDIVVAHLDAFRAPLSDADLARRRKSGLSESEEAMLARWGYPYVFQLWRFHLTLSRRLDEGEMARLKPAAEAFFATALDRSRLCDSLAVYTQAESGAPFTLSARLPFGG